MITEQCHVEMNEWHGLTAMGCFQVCVVATITLVNLRLAVDESEKRM